MYPFFINAYAIDFKRSMCNSATDKCMTEFLERKTVIAE